MSRRKNPPQEPAQKPEPAFKNTAFADALGKWKKEAPKAEAPPPPSRPQASPPPPPQPKKSKVEIDQDADDAFFLRAMGEVDRPATPAKAPTPMADSVRRQAVEEDAEALARLTEMVSDGVSRDPALLAALTRGDFRLEATLSSQKLEASLVEARRSGKRHVKVAGEVGAELGRGRLALIVLAHAKKDGDTLVLLRR